VAALVAALVVLTATLPSAATLRAHTVQHAVGLASNASVHATTVRRARLALVRGTALAPLTRADVRGVDTLRVHLAGPLGANREALARPQEALLSTVTEHNGALVALGGNLTPARPRHSTASTAIITSTAVTSTAITSTVVSTHGYTS